MGIAPGDSLTLFRLPGPLSSLTGTLTNAVAVSGLLGGFTPFHVPFDPPTMVVTARLRCCVKILSQSSECVLLTLALDICLAAGTDP